MPVTSQSESKRSEETKQEADLNNRLNQAKLDIIADADDLSDQRIRPMVICVFCP